MTGLAGIISPHSSTPVESIIDKMIAAMQRRTWFHVGKAALPGAALAAISLAETCSIAERNGVYLAASGFIADSSFIANSGFIAAEPGDRPGAKADSLSDSLSESLSETLLARFLHLGARGLGGLNGQYVAAVWEANSRKLTLVNDRLGLHRIYYWQAQDSLLFSSEIKALSSLPGFRLQIDEAGLSDLLFADHLLDDRTLFEDIKALPGASVLTYQDGRLAIRQYWDYYFAPPGNRLPDEQGLLEELDHHIFQSVQRRLRPDTCLLLTGGLDSRTIIGMLMRCRGETRVITNTIGTEDSSEVIWARQIATAAGLEHTTIPIDSSYLAAYSSECINRTEGSMSCHASWIFAEDAFLPAHQIRYVMTGLFGEAISGRNWAPGPARELSPTEALEQYELHSRRNSALLAEVLRPEVYSRVVGESLRSIKRTLALAGSHYPLNQFDYLHLHQKLRRHAGSADVLGDYCQTLEPFTDNHLVDFALSIPPALRQRGQLFKKMIASRLPEVARIGYGHTGKSLKELVARENDLLFRLTARGRRLIRGKRPAPLVGAIDLPGSGIQYNGWLRTGSQAFVLEALSHTETLEDYFDLPAVKKLVTEHMEGKRNEFRMIGAILTFSLWRRQFCQAGC
jgi:asparagine synthase (glutamine-hydrolysing)